MTNTLTENGMTYQNVAPGTNCYVLTAQKYSIKYTRWRH